MELPATLTLSPQVFKYWVIDRTRKQIRILLQNGEELTQDIPASDPILKSEIATTIFDWEKWWVENVTKRGDLVVAEAYSPITKNPLRDRPVVYLDQNHWSTLAQALTDPSRIRRKAEIAPALELVRLANDGGIVIPLSSAHLRETSPLGGNRRYEVGVAMAQISGGWQMRHPNDVWRSEITRLLAGEFGIAVPDRAKLPVFTLEPHALMDDGVDAHAMDSQSKELFVLAHTFPSVLLELLIDPAAQAPVELPEWMERNQAITQELTASGLSKDAKRRAAYVYAWADNSLPVQLALGALGLTSSSIAHLTDRDLPRLLGSQPMLGYFSSLFVQRHLDRSTKWKANDLTDLMFLACASGYGNYVAAENHTGGQLQRLQASQGLPETVFTSLEQVLTAIKSDGVKSASERESSSAL